ncbi:hypothetical protein FGG08_001342 [Glutinoglossum americanum]|uniref:G-patch domain-containing protein n=1 Tax=Glutinoglossum americanum TaxID=1670608 RepID=A0A9P8IBD2_9PEZI|nr:hypothetical protein FGG08_001342 [Glutinoglossum americanum]
MNAFVDSSSDSSESDEILFPPTDPNVDEFTGSGQHRRKRRKTGRAAKESAALGVFGSESEDEGPGQRWKQKSLRSKGLKFVNSKAYGAEKDEDEEHENEDEDEDEDEEMGVGEVEETAGLRGGLGWGSFSNSKASQEENTVSLESPLGRGFVPRSSQIPILNFAPPVENSTPKTAHPSFASPAPPFRQNGRGAAQSTPAVNPNSFAAKMMAKMGYVPGQGLGSSGQGILNPIETKLRPVGVGLGVVKEKTQQAKDEAKREATRRGENYEGSSEEEKKKRRRKQKDGSVGTGSGTSTPGGSRAKPKKKYRTGAEIEAAAEGLEVPNVLKSIVDLTGKETRLLASASGLLTPGGTGIAPESESLKIARRARRDLEAFADEWNGLSERKKYVEHQATMLSQEIDDQQEEIRKLKDVVDAVERLNNLHLDQPAASTNPQILEQHWDRVVSSLETLEVKFQDEIEIYGLPEIAVAAIHPLFRAAMEDWDPLEEPSYLVDYIHRLRNILRLKTEADSRGLTRLNGHVDQTHSNKSTTHYQTMMYTLWLPKIRSAINNTWDVHDPSPAISLIEAWKDITPSFIYANVMNQLVVQKLTAAVSEWNPRVSSKKRHQALAPHIWLFPWLQYLDEHHTDPKSSTGLLADVKRKFRVVIDTWDLSKGIIDGLKNWKEVLRGELDHVLIRHLLPRLALLLQSDFEINPADQNLAPLERVLKWKDFFRPSVVGELLIAEFFPKWHNILHLWLISEPNYEEVGEWFTWWKGRIPEEVNEVRAVTEEWGKGLKTINHALDLGDAAKTDLPLPTAGPARPIKAPSTPTKRPSKTPTTAIDTPTFRDVIEAWCSDENLLLMPLREAHETTGSPLFRVTASANGKGGAIVYLRGDVVWAQNKKNKSVWEPVGLGDALIKRAEGK